MSKVCISNPGTRSNAKVSLDCSLVPEDRSPRAKTDAYIHYYRRVDGFAPDSSKPIVLQPRPKYLCCCGLVCRFLFIATRCVLCAWFAFSHVWRKIKRGFLSSSLLFPSCILRLFVSFFLLFFQRQVDVTAILVKANRDGNEERMRRFSPTSLSRLTCYSEICC